MSYLRVAIGAAPLVLAIVAFATPSAAEQSSSITSQPAPTGRETDFELGADFGYDSNVARSDRALAAKRGLTLPDETATPRASFAVARPIGRMTLFVKGDGTYEAHRVNAKRDKKRVDVGGGVTGAFLRCHETLDGDYGLQSTDLADLQTNIISNLRTSEDVKFSTDCGGTTGFAPQASVSNAWVSNSDSRLARINNRTLTASGGLGYRQPALGTLSVTGEWSETVYPDRGGALPGTTLSNAYDVYSVGGRFERKVGARFDTSLAVSYTRLDPSNPLANKFAGLTYALDADYNLSSRLKFHASAVRATAPSIRVFANYKIDETYDVDATFRMKDRLTFKLAGSIATSDYHVSQTAASVSDLTKQTIYTVDGLMVYDLSRRISVNLEVSDEERRTNFAPVNYSSTRATMGFTVKFDRGH